jgi:hypothetical protein
MITDINKTLDALCSQLSGKGSGNYVASVHLYRCPTVADRCVADTVGAALGWSVVIQSSTAIDPQQVLRSLKESLEYTGDDGAHPNRLFLASEHFKREVQGVLQWFRELLADVAVVTSFCLQEGHPFYPVFWDFGFLIPKQSNTFVLIGSSSD